MVDVRDVSDVGDVGHGAIRHAYLAHSLAPRSYFFACAHAAAFEQWSSERLSKFKIDAAVHSMVRRLQLAGYTTGLLTNGHAEASVQLVIDRPSPNAAPTQHSAVSHSTPPAGAAGKA